MTKTSPHQSTIYRVEAVTETHRIVYIEATSQTDAIEASHGIEKHYWTEKKDAETTHTWADEVKGFHRILVPLKDHDSL